jgi:signal transduction histidine kinase/DNA-binding response OmpR family regulator
MQFFKENSNNVDQLSWVYKKQIDLLYHDMPFAILSTTVVVFLLFLFLSDSGSQPNLAIWFSLFCMVIVFRSVSSWMYSSKKRRNRVNYQKAETLYVIGVILTGGLWGSVGLWLFPAVDLEGKILLFIVIVAIAAASNTTMIYRRSPVYIFTGLVILPLVFGVIFSDFPNSFAISIAMIVYMVFLLRTFKGFYKNNEKMLYLQEESIKNSQKLLIQSEKAELANQAKSEFLSLMSHELRTPLNTVLGLNELQLLDRVDPLTAKQRKRAIKINDAGHHLLSLVNDVLDFSRIETGEIEVTTGAIDSEVVLRDAMKLVEGKAKSKRIKFYIEENDEHYWVFADYTRLKQVLVNLLDNAVKYNKKGGSITVGFKNVPGQHTRISVSDTGYGIPDHLKKKLFLPFSRLNAEHMGIEGTGIGLSFSKQLVELMEGRIGMESRQGQGSCFWIELRTAKRPVHPLNRPVPVSPSKESRPAHGIKLLLAEDNLVNQEVAVEMLEQAGFEVDVANNGEQALEALAKARYNLVLMDCEMPVMDGFTATGLFRIRENEKKLPQTPVIALTAHAVEGVREKCIANGMNDFLAKPFSYDDITAKVTRWTSATSNHSSDRKPEENNWSETSNDTRQAEHRQDAIRSDTEPTQALVLDRNVLNKLQMKQKYRQKDLAKRVVKLYLQQTPKMLEELEYANKESKSEAVVHIAHTLKSSSLTVGAMKLAEACRKIEEHGVQGQIESAWIENLPTDYSAVKEALESVLEDDE